MKPVYPTAAVAAVILAALLPLGGALAFLRRTGEAAGMPDYFRVEERIARFRKLEATLPPGAELGYLSDAEPGSMRHSGLLGTARYALAPRLVHDRPGPPWTVGDFAWPRDYAALGEPHKLRVVRDFGNGLVLYRREPR